VCNILRSYTLFWAGGELALFVPLLTSASLSFGSCHSSIGNLDCHIACQLSFEGGSLALVALQLAHLASLLALVAACSELHFRLYRFSALMSKLYRFAALFIAFHFPFELALLLPELALLLPELALVAACSELHFPLYRFSALMSELYRFAALFIAFHLL
jgi:membrane protein YqaA with SNARE-associated domain